MTRIFYIFFLLSFSLKSFAIETITINRGQVNSLPISINYFYAENAYDNRLGEDIIKVISNDLKRSGIFRPISSSAFIERKLGVHHKPLFAAWRQINSNFLLNGEVKKISADRMKVSFILWDNILEKEIGGEELIMPISLWRKAAHKIADKLYEKITGEKGYFDTKIVYVSETGPYLKRVKRIAIMDSDGANHRFLTDGRNLVLTPRFSPQADKILYLSFARRQPHVYMLDLRTGREKLLGNFPGMSFAPRFSPDGRKALMSIAKHGSTHIYEMDLKTMRLIKLTDGTSINTSPSYSPDGSKIVFNSDRSGSRQLYLMDSNGNNVERISFGGGRYTAPSWSPRGDYIAFTKMTKEEGFTIGVMRPNGSSERIISTGYLVEGPTWAPNGRVIMFTKSEPPRKKMAGRTRINSIDLTGYHEQEIPTPYDASDPEWSLILN